MRLASIRLDNGEEIPCVIRDLSVSGAKLAVSARYALPAHFSIIVQGRDRAFPVRRVWRRGDLVGVTLIKADSMTEIQPIVGR